MSDVNRVPSRSDYHYFLEIPTRWRDNDSYGHLNNAVYYTLLEMVIMRYLEVDSGLDLDALGVRCFTVENGCTYHDALKYPDTVEAGLRVGRLGRTSVRYEVGLFKKGESEVKASGVVIDVFVDKNTERPIELPEAVREKLDSILSRV
ncbi:MAG: acyl-CoA thioesterase [Granulosicoccaceae bacterium]